MSRIGAAAARGRFGVPHAPAEAEPEERGEAARPQGARRQGALGAECAEARHARAEKSGDPQASYGAEFAGLEAPLVAELAPLGALQAVLTGMALRSPPGAWRFPTASRP